MNPAPTDASSTSCPFFSRPEATASFNASGIVAGSTTYDMAIARPVSVVAPPATNTTWSSCGR